MNRFGSRWLGAFGQLCVLVAAFVSAATAGGFFTEYPIPTANSKPAGIAVDANGIIWFTQNAGNNIGQMTLDGLFTEFPIPTANSQPAGITAHPDGSIWFTETAGNNIGRRTLDGLFTEYTIPTPNSGPVDIDFAIDPVTGQVYVVFAEFDANNIGIFSPY